MAMEVRSLVMRVQRTPPLVVDALIAAVAAVASLSVLTLNGANCGCGPYNRPAAALLLLAETVPLAWRRRQPIAIWIVTGIAVLTYTALQFPDLPIHIGP